MPRKVWETEQDFRDVYEILIGDPSHPKFGESITYSRLFAQRVMGPPDDHLNYYDMRVSRLSELFTIEKSDRVLVVGCGFGFLIDAFHDAGFPNIWGIDSSPYIQANRATESRDSTGFVDSDIRGPQVRAKLKALTGDWIFNWIITESVMECYQDEEIGSLLDAVEVVLDADNGLRNAVHLVVADNPEFDSIFAQKTLQQWKDIRPSHSWVNIISWEIA